MGFVCVYDCTFFLFKLHLLSVSYIRVLNFLATLLVYFSRVPLVYLQFDVVIMCVDIHRTTTDSNHFT